MASPHPDTLRQRVLDFIGADQRTRAELIAAFPGEAVMRTVAVLTMEGQLRNMRHGARGGPGIYARANSRGADLAAAWHSPTSTASGSRP